MFMFGKVNQAEYDEIVKQGWEVIRCPSIEEVDKFCDPKWKKTESETPKDMFVLVFVDNDISNALTTWFNQEIASKTSQDKEEFENKRRICADDALGTFDFHSGNDFSSLIPTSEEILDTGKWETDGPNRLICPIYYGGPGGDKKGSFVVEFKPNSIEIIDKHANVG